MFLFTSHLCADIDDVGETIGEPSTANLNNDIIMTSCAKQHVTVPYLPGSGGRCTLPLSLSHSPSLPTLTLITQRWWLFHFQYRGRGREGTGHMNDTRLHWLYGA